MYIYMISAVQVPKRRNAKMRTAKTQMQQPSKPSSTSMRIFSTAPCPNGPDIYIISV